MITSIFQSGGREADVQKGQVEENEVHRCVNMGIWDGAQDNE
jgi:hypothetical protein